MPTYKNIDNRYIKRLYTEDHLPLRTIAKMTGMSPQGINKRLKKLGVKASDRERVTITCAMCGKKKEFRWSEVRGKVEKFCSSDCYYASRENPLYAQWRQGQRIARVIVKIHYRQLQQENVVHHKDGNNKNNDISNLMVFKNQSDHIKYHHGKSKVEPIFDGVTL